MATRRCPQRIESKAQIRRIENKSGKRCKFTLHNLTPSPTRTHLRTSLGATARDAPTGLDSSFGGMARHLADAVTWPDRLVEFTRASGGTCLMGVVTLARAMGMRGASRRVAASLADRVVRCDMRLDFHVVVSCRPSAAAVRRERGC